MLSYPSGSVRKGAQSQGKLKTQSTAQSLPRGKPARPQRKPVDYTQRVSLRSHPPHMEEHGTSQGVSMIVQIPDDL